MSNNVVRSLVLALIGALLAGSPAGQATPAALPEPFRLADIRAGSSGSFPANANQMALGSDFLFAANDGVNGNELWVADGTSAGTRLLKDIHPGAGGSGPEFFAVWNGALYFTADDGVHGHELWRSDGTAAGTVLVADIWAGSSSAWPKNFTPLGDVLVFQAADGDHGAELWRSDGTEAGTVLIEDIQPGVPAALPANLRAVPGLGLAFFTADDGVSGSELWKTDGTAAGTEIVKDIEPGSGSSAPNWLTVVGDRLYFSADQSGLTGRELWMSDGTLLGTQRVADIRPGAASSSPYSLVDFGGVLFFCADDGVSGIELWKSDGAGLGTVLVKDIWPGAGSSSPTWLAVVGDRLYLAAADSANGNELWRSDGAAAGTALVEDIQPGSGSSFPAFPASLGGQLFFQADDGVNGAELWRSDGAEAGTVLIKDIQPGSGSGLPTPTYTAVGNGRLFFSASDGVSGSEPWLMPVGPDLSLVKRASVAAALPGSEIIYTLTFSNTHSYTTWQTGVVLTDSLPACVSVTGIVSATDGIVITPTGELAWAISDVPPESGGVITISGVISPGLPAGLVITNTAIIRGEWPEPPENNLGAAATAILNAPPVAGDDTAETPEDTPVGIAVLTNDTDLNADGLSVAQVGQPGHGGTSTDGTNVAYTPAPNYFGTDAFTYTVSDGRGGTDTGQVSLTIPPVNDPPAAQDDTETTLEDTPITVSVLANDGDVDGDGLSVAQVGQPGHGTTGTDGVTVAYTPTHNYFGPDSFTYTLSDGHGGTDTAAVSLTVDPDLATNDPPEAQDDSAATLEDYPVTVSVLGNDSDPDGDGLTVAQVGQPVHGSISTDGATIVYTPTHNYFGPDSFTYTLSDGRGETDTAAVSLTVAPDLATNDPPEAQDDWAETPEDTPVTVDALANDGEPDGDALVITQVGQPGHGTAEVFANQIDYTPDFRFSGVDSFTYAISDGRGGFDSAAVHVTVTQVTRWIFLPVVTQGYTPWLQMVESEPNDTFSQADPLARLPVQVQGNHDGIADTGDVFSLTLTAGQVVSVTLATSNGAGVQVVAYTAGGNEIARDYTPPLGLEFTALADGVYYLYVFTPGEANNAGSYLLSVQQTGSEMVQAAATEPMDAIRLAEPPEIGAP